MKLRFGDFILFSIELTINYLEKHNEIV